MASFRKVSQILTGRLDTRIINSGKSEKKKSNKNAIWKFVFEGWMNTIFVFIFIFTEWSEIKILKNSFLENFQIFKKLQN